MPLSQEYYYKIYPKLKYYALSLSRDKTLAEDLVSDTILRALEKAEENLSEAELCNWCLRVLRNRLIDIKRKKTEQQFNPEMPEDQGSALQTEQHGYTNILYSRCMSKLTDTQREVIILNLFEGQTARAISELLGKPQNTVLTWLSKAKSELYDCLTA